MNDIGNLVQRLVDAGLSVSEAGEIIATAFAAGVASSVHQKSPGAIRQQRYRERHKASPNVTRDTSSDASQTVTNRNEVTLGDDASLYKKEKKEEIKKEKREGQRASQLSPDWLPSAGIWAQSVMLLGSEERAERELTKFRNHAADKGRTSKRWDQAFSNWAIKAVEYGGQSYGNRATNSRTTGHDAILAAASREAGRIARDDELARSTAEAEFPFGDVPDRSREGMDRRPHAGASGDHDGREPSTVGVFEGEVIPPDQASPGVSNAWRRH